MEIIKLEKYNEVYNKIYCEPSIGYEIKDYFTFKVPNYQFIPAYRNKLWDGNIYLYNPLTCLLYGGLNEHLEEFCKQRNYKIEYLSNFDDTEFSVLEAKDFVKTLNLPFEPRDYQLEAFVTCVRKNRKLILSPTASGKSMLLYLITRYYNKKTLIIVPTTSLIHQLGSDFISYGLDNPDSIHRIFQGQDKISDAKYFISTWQSIYKQPKKWFEQFDVVIGDECLHPDTKINMSDDTKKEIKNIKIGDFVKTYNEKTKKIENKKVIKVHQNISIEEDFYEIETNSGTKLNITGNHKVLLKSGEWKRVDELKIGDIINSI